MKRLLLLTICLFTISLFGNENNPIKNLDFEVVENGKPLGWKSLGSEEYKVEIDSLIYQRGEQSISITHESELGGYKVISYEIPANYQGEKIKLSGFLKTEDVVGVTGLWMRLDPSVGFKDMIDLELKGTTDWQKYEIDLDFNPSRVDNIVAGVLLSGTGKIWVDNLAITIDGKPLDQVPPKELPKAEKDKEFVEGSRIESIELNDDKVENLRVLGMVWGFLKYHHPNIAKGDFNWDFELFRVLPKIIQVESRDERDNILSGWISSLGEFQKGEELSNKNLHLKMKPDLAWIENSNLSSQLVGKLNGIKEAKRLDYNYYVNLNLSVENPNFKNEAKYPTMNYPDAGFRLLTLYRYWNIIQYYFPYKYLIDEDWKTLLPQFIPTFINAENELQYTLAALELIGKVDDTHANIWGRNESLNRYWGVNYTPLKLRFIEDRAVVVDYFDDELGKETGIGIGSEIKNINGKSIDEIVKSMLKFTPASNYPTQLRDIAKKLLRSNDSLMSVDFFDGKELKSRSIKTYSTEIINIYKTDKDTCFKLINDDIALINNGTLKNEDLPEIWEKIKDKKGLIIDNRNYPSDFLVFGLGSYLMPDSIPFVKFATGSIEQPGTFKYAETLSVGKKNDDYYKGKVVILVDETSQSSSEYHAMAYKAHPNATVVGSTTAAADGNISMFFLPGNIYTGITGIGVYYPDNNETQRVGIVPDIEVKPTIEGIRSGRDEVLEKAIELIEG